MKGAPPKSDEEYRAKLRVLMQELQVHIFVSIDVPLTLCLSDLYSFGIDLFLLPSFSYLS